MSRVMIIEDEPSIVMVLKEMLTDEGYEVYTAYDGSSGLKKLKEIPRPDLVLLDLNMPGISGKCTVESMRLDNELKDIPVIIVTGTVYNTSDFPSQGSYQDILEKPFDLMDMMYKVKRITNYH